jgi:RNA polymerase sigma-70 factor (ECF subfamily)
MDAHEIPPEALLRHAGFLRGLARHLVWQFDGAEDVVQETWLASLEHPPRGSGRVRAWLSKVLRNEARQHLRGERRRPRRELRAARPAVTESTAEGVIRSEVLQRVAAAVALLEEPYRTTILLRHYEQLAPREIAVLMKAPIDTVKSRLQRAHERLRNALERGGSGWRAALLPLAGPDLSAGSASEATTGAFAKGVEGMGTKLMVAGAGALLAGCGVVIWLALGSTREAQDLFRQDEDGIPARSEPVDTAAEPSLRGAGSDRRSSGEVARVAAADGSGSRAAAEPGASPLPDAAPAATPKLRSIEGAVTLGGRPVAGGSIRVVLDGGRPVEAAAGDEGRTVLVAGDGTFRILEASLGAMVLVAEVAGFAPREIRVQVGDDVEQRITIALGSGRIWGTVFDGLGRPAEDVRVTVSTYLREGAGGLVPSAEGDPFAVRERTDLRGHYEFRGLPVGSHVVVAEPESDRSDPRNIRSFAITLAADEDRRLDIGSPREDPLWSGVVRYADGVPVKGPGNVFLQAETGENRLYVSFNAEGRVAQQVPPGRYRMEFVLTGASPGLVQFSSMRLVPTGERLTVEDRALVKDLTLPGIRVDGRVEGLNPGASTPMGERQHVVLTLIEAKEPLPEPIIGRTTVHLAVVGADGTFSIDGLAPGTYSVRGSPRSVYARRGPGATIEIPDGRARMDLLLMLGPE